MLTPEATEFCRISRFEQRFFDSFGKELLLGPKGDNKMMLELIYHPKYGIMKEFLLFEELPDEPGGYPPILCPECGGSFRYDTSELIKRSLKHPDHTM